MMIKVIHILNHLEKIDRDIKEIEHMRNQLQLDRTYSAVVQESLNVEMTRLTRLQNTIGSLVISNPPVHLVTDIEDHIKGNEARPISQLANQMLKQNTTPRVDVHIPASIKEQKGVSKPDNPDNGETKKRQSKKSASKSNRDTNGFQWKFVQK